VEEEVKFLFEEQSDEFEIFFRHKETEQKPPLHPQYVAQAFRPDEFKQA